MATTETKQRRDGGRIVEGELRGCEIAMIATPRPTGVGYICHIDKAPATYCRSLTPAELASLAAINPDDGVGDAALTLLCDLTLALATLTGNWEGAYPATGATKQGREMAAIFAPLLDGELGELGRVAGELIAAVGGTRP